MYLPYPRPLQLLFWPVPSVVSHLDCRDIQKSVPQTEVRGRETERVSIDNIKFCVSSYTSKKIRDDACIKLIIIYLKALHKHRVGDVGKDRCRKLDVLVAVHEVLKLHQIPCLKLEVKL